MYDFDDAVERSDQVEGWLRHDEKPFLYESALHAPGVVVEIGSWKGRSTTLMGCAVKSTGNRIYAVDPFGKPEKMDVLPFYDLWKEQGQDEHYEDFIRNITEQGVADVVVPIRAMSSDAIEIYKDKYNEPIGFLFIDGCHHRDFVQQDFDLWSPFVVKGGIVAFHDAYQHQKDFDDSAAIVARDELILSDKWEHGIVKSIVWGRKL